MTPTDDSTPLQYDETYHFGIGLVNLAHVVNIPYCRDCEAHAIWHRDFGMLGTIGWVLGMGLVTTILAGFAVAIGLLAGAAVLEAVGVASALFRGWLPPVWGVLVASIVALVMRATWRRRMKRRPALPVGLQHASPRFAAALVGASNETVTLALLSDRYAQAVLSLGPSAQAMTPPPGFVARPDKTPAWHIGVLLLMITIGVLAYLGLLK